MIFINVHAEGIPCSNPASISINHPDKLIERQTDIHIYI